MKSLSNYLINESGPVIGELPFTLDLFGQFMEECIIKGAYESSPIWQKMEQLVTNKYDKHIWDCFRGWCESYFMSKTDLKTFYENFKLIPISRLSKLLGSGSNGIVLDMGSRCLKLFYGNKIPSDDKKFYKYIMKNPHPNFPKIYRMGTNWVVMEKLLMYTDLCKEYSKLFDVDVQYIEYGLKRKQKAKLYKIAGRIATTKLDKHLPKIFIDDDIVEKVLHWCIDCAQIFKEIDYYWPGDLALKNIGERPDTHEVVYFDI